MSVFLLMVVPYHIYGQEDSVFKIINWRLNNIEKPIKVQLDTLYAQSLIGVFYKYSNEKPIWTNYISSRRRLKKLINIIENSEQEGLNPQDYHLNALNTFSRYNIWQLHRDPSMLADLDMLLSDAFLTLSTHYFMGKVNNSKIFGPKENVFVEKNIPLILWNAVQSNDLESTLFSLLPHFKQYTYLKEGLKFYKEKLETYPDSTVFRNHYNKIAINMERWRWIPKPVDSIFIVVNIPGYHLWVFQNDEIILNMKTIVGKVSTPTPTFNCALTYLVVQPRWNIPNSIMKEELLPKILKDTAYLRRNRIYIVKNWSDYDAIRISPRSLSWESISTRNFPYKLVQSSGGGNPLGNVKFMFPNEYDVYLHDTPNYALFNKTTRAYSHGCIRIEKANELAFLLTQNQSL
ncbi:MAG: L,D-transpeptidase family protein, partial [Cyclobacteriaceae bacterium]|nr:L,D-transpeptidase family protein [Cyclobacteriaceae bacterium]